MKSCFHCNDTKRCDCLVCCGDFKSGPCQACKGRARMIELSAVLDRYGVDVRDSLNWFMYKGELHQPAPAQRRLLIEAALRKQAA